MISNFSMTITKLSPKVADYSTLVMLLVFLLILVNGSNYPAAARQGNAEHAPRQRIVKGQIVFKLKDTPSVVNSKQAIFKQEREKKFCRKYCFKNMKPLNLVRKTDSGKNFFRAALAEGQEVNEAVSRLNADPQVEWAEPVYYRYSEEEPVVPNDPRYSDQAYLNVMSFPMAWNISTGNSSVVVAVIDTGIDLDHPDLQENIWQNNDEIAGDGLDNDANGFIDDVQGWDFVSVPVSEVATGEDFAPPDNDPSDVHGHGTHVAGIIGARGDNGNYGVGGNWQVSLMPVRAGYKNKNGQGMLTTVDIAAALHYACDNGADIVNMSFGGPDAGMVEREAIAYCAERNVLLVAAAGNSGSSDPSYPAAFEPVFAVASVGTDKKISDCSNYGIWIDAAACGRNIYSTLPQGGFGLKSGTSMATAMVSAEAALLKDIHPEWFATEISARIHTTATNINLLNPDYNNLLGAGLIDTYKAINGTQMLLRYPGLVALEISEDNLLDDTYLDPGETFFLCPTIRNFGIDQDDVSLVLISDDPYITIQDNTINMGRLVHDQQLTVPDDFFAVNIAQNTPLNHQAKLKCRVYLGASLVAEEPVSLLLNPFMRNKVIIDQGTEERGYARSRIVENGDNGLTLFYRSTGSASNDVVARYRDAEGNWHAPEAVPGKNHVVCQSASAADNIVYLENGSLYYRRYNFQDSGWIEAVKLSADASLSDLDRYAVAVDEQSNPHVIWTDGLALHYRYSDGTDWSTDMVIAALDKNVEELYIFFAADEQPLILWRQDNDEGSFTPEEIDMLQRESIGNWSEIMPVAPRITNSGFSVAVDSFRNLQMVYDSSGSSIDYTVFDDIWSEPETLYSNCLGIEKILLATEADQSHIIRLSKPNWGAASLLYGMNYDTAWSPFTPIAVQKKLIQLDEKDFKVNSRGDYLLSGSCICNNSILFYSSEVNEDHYPSRPLVRAGVIVACDAGEIAVSLTSSQSAGIAAYRFALGTAPGSDDILAWCQSDEKVTEDGSLDITIPVQTIIFQPGKRYYVSGQAVGNNGYWSPVGSSNGLFCPAAGSIFDADNDVDGLDLSRFAGSMAAGGTEADINGNSVADDYDFADFTRLFGLRD